MKAKLILLIIILPIINLNAQYLVNTPFTYYQDYQLIQKNLFHDFKPIDYDTINKQQDTASIKPLFFSTTSYDLSQKQFIINSIIGINTSVKYNKLKINIIPIAGIYRNELFSTFIDSTQILPGIGKIQKNLNNKLYFYSYLQGFIRWQATDFINFEIGKNRTFLGNGYRSLWLSDFSEPYPYFRSIAQVWKIKYLYQIAWLADKNPQMGTKFYSKFNFTHLLSFNIFNILNINMFETVMSGAYDSLGLHRGIEFAYLNPVIFFRSVDLTLGSPDNVIMGLGGNIKLFKSTILYSQAFIDEFLISHYLSSSRYWDNKYGIQIGYKSYKTLSINGLYTQAEINLVRPYTYSHNTMYLAYGNRYQPLAHPTGANFYEAVVIAQYHMKNYFIQLKTSIQKAGFDDTLNQGKNIYLSYLTHYKETNNFITQGQVKKLYYIEFSIGGKNKNLYWQIFSIYRKIENKNLILGISIGYNYWQKTYWDYF